MKLYLNHPVSSFHVFLHCLTHFGRCSALHYGVSKKKKRFLGTCQFTGWLSICCFWTLLLEVAIQCSATLRQLTFHGNTELGNWTFIISSWTVSPWTGRLGAQISIAIQRNIAISIIFIRYTLYVRHLHIENLIKLHCCLAHHTNFFKCVLHAVDKNRHFFQFKGEYKKNREEIVQCVCITDSDKVSTPSRIFIDLWMYLLIVDTFRSNSKNINFFFSNLYPHGA